MFEPPGEPRARAHQVAEVSGACSETFSARTPSDIGPGAAADGFVVTGHETLQCYQPATVAAMRT